jgi:Gpi18-like mannosyltransferase
MKKEMRLTLIVLVAVLLRMILAFSSSHPDLQALGFAGQLISKGHLLDLYDYIGSLPAGNCISQAYPADLFIYPPIIYGWFGFWNLLFNNFFSNLFLSTYIFNYPQVLGNLQLNFYLLLLKMPYLIFDLGAAALIYRLFDDKRSKIWAVTLWLFNPVSIYATYMMGQFDLIATFFVILSLYLVKKAKGLDAKYLYPAALALGLGAAFKIYPLFLLVPLVSLTEGFSQRVKLLIVGVVPYILLIAPFLLSPGFRHSALVANLTQKSFFAQIPISGGESLILFPVFVLAFYLWFWYHQAEKGILWQRYFIILLLFFIFTHYHPQWFTWLSPFLIFYLVSTGFKRVLPVLLALFSFIGLLFFFDSSLTLGIFSPVFINSYNTASLWQLLGVTVDQNYCRSILQTIFTGTAIYFIYQSFKEKDSAGSLT